SSFTRTFPGGSAKTAWTKPANSRAAAGRVAFVMGTSFEVQGNGVSLKNQTNEPPIRLAPGPRTPDWPASAKFGRVGPQNTNPNTQPSTKKNTNSDTARRFETSRHR